MTWPIKVALCVVAGAMFFLSCANFDIWPLAWFAAVPALIVTLDPSTKRVWFYGLIVGLVADGGGFYWLLHFLQQFGHLPLVAALPIHLLLVSYQALIFMFFFIAVRRLRDATGLPITLFAPVIFVAIELCIPNIFPWYLAITQAWVLPVIQIAELTGPLGVSFLLILTNCLIYEIFEHRWHKKPLPRRRLAVGFAILVASLAFGFIRIAQVSARRAAAPKIRVGVVQANIGIHEKFRPGLALQQLQAHQQLSAELERRGADLIVWPESSYPGAWLRNQGHDWSLNDRRAVQRGFDKPLIFGALSFDNESIYPYNTAILLDGEHNVRGLFDKNILMVFGEYIPYFEQLRFIKKWIPEVSNMARGHDVAVFPLEITSKPPILVAPMICYEDIFPSFGRRLAKLHPNILVNITNDAWFGPTSEPYEHMALSVFRSVEMRLDLVRAVNTGVSAVIDATGRVIAQSPSVDPDTDPPPRGATLLEDVAVLDAQTLYARLGEWFGGLCLLISVVLSLWATGRAGRPVRWPLVGLGAAVLLAVTLLGVAVARGPSSVATAIALLAHRNVSVAADAAFATGIALAISAAVGALLAGAAITLRSRQRLRLEPLLAVLAILVVPAILAGSLEGEQAGLVIGALLAIALSILGTKLASLVRKPT